MVPWPWPYLPQRGRIRSAVAVSASPRPYLHHRLARRDARVVLASSASVYGFTCNENKSFMALREEEAGGNTAENSERRMLARVGRDTCRHNLEFVVG